MPRGNKGERKKPRFYYLKLSNLINLKNEEEFSAGELSIITGIEREKVRCFLIKKTLKGELERTRRGFYKKTKNKILVTAPKAQIADSVWKALHKKEIILRKELREYVRELTGLAKDVSVSAINTAIKILFQGGYIIRVDAVSKREIAYSLKKEYWHTERPLFIN